MWRTFHANVEQPSSSSLAVDCMCNCTVMAVEHRAAQCPLRPCLRPVSDSEELFNVCWFAFFVCVKLLRPFSSIQVNFK